MHSEMTWLDPKTEPPNPGRILAVYDDPVYHSLRAEMLDVVRYTSDYYLKPGYYGDRRIDRGWVVAYIREEDIIGDLPARKSP